MPPVALESLEHATVATGQWSPNSARTIQVRHEIPVDDARKLAAGDEVTYTDPDLGVVFVGKVTRVTPNYNDGEGFTYQCADAYRTLSKTPAFIVAANGKRMSKIKFVKGTLIHTAIDTLFADAAITSLFPGGIDKSALENNALPEIDKGGQNYDVWIDDLLNNTTGGICYVDPNDGSPKLVFRDFYLEPDVTLQIGSFEPLTPAGGDDPVMESANAGDTTDRKYERVIMEGCGDWLRKEDVLIQPTLLGFDAEREAVKIAFIFPEELVTGRYLDGEGKCRDDIIALITVGFEDTGSAPVPNPQRTFELHNFPVEPNPGGGMRGVIWIRQTGVFDEPDPDFSINVVGRFFYTAYIGPILGEAITTDPALADEGAYWEHHPEFFKFTGPAMAIQPDGYTSVDQTSFLQTLADERFDRFAEGVDTDGSIRTHVSGIEASLKPGSRITNPEFNDTRVQSISWDFVQRSHELQVSTIPLRDDFKRFKQEVMEQSREGGGWYQNKDEETNCFCGGQVFQDEAGPTGGDDDGARTWDCDQQGQCQERNDDRGQYQNQQDCEDDCAWRSWEFVDCVGCSPRKDVNGQYPNQAACEAANPDPFADCDWICNSGLGCVPVPDGMGVYETRAACEAACEGGNESGSGDPGTGGGSGLSVADPVDPFKSFDCGGCFSGGSFGFVQAIVVNDKGEVNNVTCNTCSAGGGDPCDCCSSGFTGTVSTVCAVDFLGETVSFQAFEYSCGLLISVGPCGGI